MKTPHRTIATLAVVVTAGIAIPLGNTANAAETTPVAAHYAIPMAAAFDAAAHRASGRLPHTDCDVQTCDYANAEVAASQAQAPAYTSPAQAALAGAASGATSGALAGLVTGGPEGALVGAGVGGVGGAVGGAAAAAVNNAVSGATAGGKSFTPSTHNDTAFD